MQIKNKAFFILLLCLFLFNSVLHAEEFDIAATEITIDSNNNILTGSGDVEIRDKEGKVIKANKVIYDKSKEFITADGAVEVIDTLGNILKANKVTYDKINEIISTFENSELNTKEGYNLKSKNIIYNSEKKILSSNTESILTDMDGNNIMLSMFQYNIEQKLLSGLEGCSMSFERNINLSDLKNQLLEQDIVSCDNINWSFLGISAATINALITLLLFLRAYAPTFYPTPPLKCF